MNLVLVVLVMLDAEIQSMGKVNFLDTRGQSRKAVRKEEQLVKDRGWRDKRVVESMEITITRFAIRRNNLGIEVELDSCDLRQRLSYYKDSLRTGGYQTLFNSDSPV